ncbi:MAG: hypothetical protein QNJ74_01305 [Trichodesmium sp. MO_231.B1]|nr:hypothetical protein [Trichodesmium sp. MO_231.B1]
MDITCNLEKKYTETKKYAASIKTNAKATAWLQQGRLDFELMDEAILDKLQGGMNKSELIDKIAEVPIN